jgi:hypothetical protein
MSTSVEMISRGGQIYATKFGQRFEGDSWELSPDSSNVLDLRAPRGQPDREILVPLEVTVNTRFLTELEVKERTGISVDTLRRWRLEDKGPVFRKFGALVRYGDEDLATWEDNRVAGGERAPRIPPDQHSNTRFRKAS